MRNCHFVSKIIAICLIITIMLSFCQTILYAQADVEVNIMVTERSGTNVENYPVIRGVALAKEAAYEGDSFIVENDLSGEIFPVQSKAVQKYPDGSIQWLKVVFLCNLEANEQKNLTLKKGSLPSSDLTYIENVNSVTVSNSAIKLYADINQSLYISEADGDGIFSVVPYFKANGVDENYIINGISILENGSLYITVKVAGSFRGFAIEQIFTIYSGSKRIQSEIRFISENENVRDYVTVNSMGQRFSFENGYNEFMDCNGVAQDSILSSSGFMTASDGIQSVAIVTRDIERFNGSGGANTNGFYFTSNNKSLGFSPILYNSNYSWYDGISRTARADIIISEKTYLNAENYMSAEKNQPSVKIDPIQYVSAGIIDDSTSNSLLEAQTESAKWIKNIKKGFDAGAFPLAGDPDNGYAGNWEQRPGEIQYYLWFAEMMSGDGDLYDVISDSVDAWADINIYRGAVTNCRGAGRYRITYENSAIFMGSQPYYGDGSGIILSYLMTGNEYYRETARLMADYTYRNAMSFKKSGDKNVVSSIDWFLGYERNTGYTEVRYVSQARSMYMAYELFEDARYLNITNEIIDWLSVMQLDNGTWYQGYYIDGTPLKLDGYNTPVVKNYITLYGLRAICDIYRKTQNETASDVLIGFADYLLTQQQDNGWFWDTPPEIPVNEVSSDGTRGRQPMLEIMAADILETAYEITDDEQYLSAMLSAVRCFVGESQKNGLSPVRYNAPEYAEGIINSIQYGQNLTYMKLSTHLAALLNREADIVNNLGYSDLLEIFINNAEWYDVDILRDKVEFVVNGYKCGDNSTIYMTNFSSYNTHLVNKEINFTTSEDGSLWSGMKNTVLNTGQTIISGILGVFEGAYLRKLPITVCNGSAVVCVDVVSSSDSGYVLDVECENGIANFNFLDMDEISYTVEEYADKIRLTVSNVTDGMSEQPTVALDFGENTDYETQHVMSDARELVEIGSASEYTVHILNKLETKYNYITKKQREELADKLRTAVYADTNPNDMSVIWYDDFSQNKVYTAASGEFFNKYCEDKPDFYLNTVTLNRLTKDFYPTNNYTSGVFVIETDFMKPSIGRNDFIVSAGNAGGRKLAYRIGTDVYGNINLSLYRYNNNTVSVVMTTIGTYAATKWYNLKCEVNMNTKILRVYINGERVMSDQVFEIDSSITDISRLFNTMTNLSMANGDVYIDNLLIYNANTRDGVFIENISAEVSDNGNITVALVLLNGGAYTKPASVITAIKKDRQLLECKQNVFDGINAEESKTIMNNFSVKNNYGIEIDAFLWSGCNNMIPLTGAKKLYRNGRSIDEQTYKYIL